MRDNPQKNAKTGRDLPTCIPCRTILYLSVFTFDYRYKVLLASIGFKATEAVVLLLQSKRNSEVWPADSFDGFPPLHLAVNCGCEEILEILLKNGFDVNEKYQPVGHTPLHVAVCNEQSDMAELLLKHNADANMVTDNGDTPLLLAIQDDNVVVVGLLLKYGADATKPGITHLYARSVLF